MSIKDRIERVRALMKEKNIDVYYIPTDDDHMSEYIADYYKCRKYISGFTGSAGFVVITQDEAGLWTDGRYFVQAERELKGSGIKLFKMAMAGVPTVFEYICNKCKDGATLGFDGRVVKTSMLKQLQEKLSSEMVIDVDLVGDVWEDRPAMPQSKAYILEDKYVGLNVKDKLAKVREDLTAKGQDWLVVSALEDVAWLFNLRGDDVSDTPVNYAYALIGKDVACLYIDDIKLDTDVKGQLMKNKVDIRPYDYIGKDLNRLKDTNVWVSPEKLNAYLYQQLDDCAIYEDNSPIEMYRAIKNDVEIKNTRKAHIKDGVAMVKFLYWLKNTIGKEELDEVVVQNKLYELRSQQDDYIEPSFSTICAYQDNAAMMHYSASEDSKKVLEPKGFLLVDSGGTYKDGTTDITRTICLGEVSDSERFYYTTVLRAMINLSQAKFLRGTTGANLDILARGICWQHDIDYQCGTGHGVGHVLSVHEGPHGIRWGVGSALSSRVIFEPGMIVTNEPGIYLPNKLGIRIENELLVEKGVNNEYGQFLHFDPITMCPIDLDAVDVSLMTDSEINYLNEYHELVYKNISPYLDAKEQLWLKTQTRKVIK